MGLLFVYFTAPGDAAAAEVIDWVSGPDVPDEQTGAEPYPSAEINIDRSTQLTWVAMMDSDPSGEIPEPELAKVVATKNGGEAAVYRLSTAARDALARLSEDPEDPAVLELLEDLGDPNELIDDAPDLIQLATLAKERGWSLYAWFSL